MQLYNKYKSQGLEFISVNVSDTAPDAKKFFAKYGATWIGTVNGSPTDVADLYKADSTPRNFVINREGQIIREISGYSKGDKRLDQALKRAGIEMLD